MASRGPLIPARARTGGIVLAIAALQFVVAMVVVQLAYPGYRPVAQDVSDLGRSGASPLALVFDLSVAILGVLGLAAAFLLRSGFAARTTSRLGLGSLGVASLGALAVGIFPEGSAALGGGAHALASLAAFLGAGLALLFLGLAMVRDTRWDGFRAYTALSGVVTLLALAAYVGGASGGPVGGAVERVVIAPVLLWGLVAGAHLGRLPVFAAAPRTDL